MTHKEKYLFCKGCETYKQFIEKDGKLFFMCGEGKGDCGVQMEIELPTYLHYETEMDKLDKEKETQDVFDNVFQNIEYNFREMGHGDVAVNKKMKSLTRIFYDVLVNLDKNDSILTDNNHYFLKKYFFDEEKKGTANIDKLSDYFSKFQNFCFDLDVKNMLNGSFNFIYR